MTDATSAPPYTRQFWAKAYPYRKQGPDRIHLLEHHMADVGACFEALLTQPTIRQRLACSGDMDSLDDATAARLALFAALHDIGKVNTGFQTQIWRQTDSMERERRPSRAGHTLDLVPVLNGDDAATAEWFFDALGWWRAATESWDDRNGETFCGLFVAALSHHGLPVPLEGGRSPNPGIWRPYSRLEPQEQVRRIGDLTHRWFPSAWNPDALPLPSTPAFQHTFLGLCALADWVGSNEVWFPFCAEPRDSYMDDARERAESAIRAVGLDLRNQRRSFAVAPGFDELFPHVSQAPNAIQRAAAQDTQVAERLVIIESETGSGKTEAALWRYARMYEEGLVDGLYFALPTRAAAMQIHRRVEQFVENLFPERTRPRVVLAVPGYDPGAGTEDMGLPEYEVWYDSRYGGDRPWASENPKRYLAAQIAVGTVDQAMMAALKVKHAHLRAACLARNLLVVDEIHASDTYMRRVLKALLDAHLGAGGYALLMSATLGSAARRQWLSMGNIGTEVGLSLRDAMDAPYPSISVRSPDGEHIAAVGENRREKTVSVSAEPLMGEFEKLAGRALQAARAGAKVLIVRNTVGYAISTQRAVEEASGELDHALLFALDGKLTLHHGRFAAVDRRLLDRAVEERLGKDRASGGLVVVGTQTLEQSLDIDADLLITDLCPVDVLLQRIGRLHRHSRGDRPADYSVPGCTVLTPSGGDLSPLLDSPINGLGVYVYEDLRMLESTRRLMGEFPRWAIPAMNRELVEKGTHPEVLEKIAQELGEGWVAHGRRVRGEDLADGLTAQSAILRRDKSFFNDNRDVVFSTGVEEKIRTRLGDDRIDVQLAPQPPSPFGQSRRIDRVTLPVRWIGGVPIEGPTTPVEDSEGFCFVIGGRTFRYDRLGLRSET